jgi:hypothetical protein
MGMQILVIGSKNLRLRLVSFADIFGQLMQGGKYVLLLSPGVTGGQVVELSPFESLVQILSRQFTPRGVGISFVPTQASYVPLHKITRKKQHVKKLKQLYRPQGYQKMLRSRSPRGGIAILRQEVRSSNPNRKPRRNGSR